jgi:hypothetical protein
MIETRQHEHHRLNGEPLHRGRVRGKWDYVSDPGYLTLPYVLLLHQAELEISSEHLNVLLNIIAHWHSNGRMPHPRSTTIARRMGTSPRTVQRSMSWLIANGFLAKTPKLNRRDAPAVRNAAAGREAEALRLGAHQIHPGE